MSNIERVDFYGDELLVVGADGQRLVAVRPICDALGVSHGSQMNKLKTKPWAVVSMINTTGADGKTYRMASIPLRAVPMWLATIESTKVAPAVRARLERYQVECAEVLARHFAPKAAPPASPSVDASVSNGARMGDSDEGKDAVRRRCRVAAKALGVTLQAVYGQIRRITKSNSPFAVSVLDWKLRVEREVDDLAIGRWRLPEPKRRLKPADPRQTALSFGVN